MTRGPHSRSGAVPSGLVAAYRAAHYKVFDGTRRFTLRVDRRSPELLDLYRRLGVSSAACITACNPLSRKLRDADNRRRMRALERAVTELRCRVLPTLGQDPRGHWPDEPGLLVLGANPNDIAKLGHRFEQNAVLIARRDAVPRLIVNLTKPGTRTAFYT